MSGIFGDQAFVERVIDRAGERFRYCAGLEKWLEKRGSLWADYGAEENIRAEYRQVVAESGEGVGREKWIKVNAMSASGQDAIVRLLSKEPRLLLSPEQLADEFPIRPPFPTTEESLPLSNLAIGLSYGGNRRELEDWTLRARARVESSPNVVIRTDHNSPDLGTLACLFEEVFGPYVTRVPPETWTHFPKTLSPDLAWQLTGTSVCFLEGPENWETWRKFPQWSLQRLVSWGSAEWVGRDRVRYRLRLPLFFIVTGPPFTRSIERELASHVIEVRTRGKGYE